MNNKNFGSKFEQFMCGYLAEHGWWVHFLSPDRRGAQPFDIIAVKDDIPIAMDCKTCEDHIFRIERLEDNQKTAFSYWLGKGNSNAYIIVLHKSSVYAINFEKICIDRKVDLAEEIPIIREVCL